MLITFCKIIGLIFFYVRLFYYIYTVTIKQHKMKKLFVIAIATLALASCTDNSRAKNWGGTEEVSLNPNEVVLNVTWKESQMWICTRDTVTNLVYFREKSSYGVLEGTVILK